MNALTKIAYRHVKRWIDHQNQRIEQARARGDHALADTLTAELNRRLGHGRR